MSHPPYYTLEGALKKLKHAMAELAQIASLNWFYFSIEFIIVNIN